MLSATSVPHPTLCVVTVTYNSEQVLPACLESLDEQLPSAEVIIVDNGSADQTLAVATAHRRSRIIRLGANVGFGTAVNAGALAADGDLLLILNPDATIAGADLGRLRQIDDRSRVGVLGCAVRGEHGDHFLLAPVWGWRAELRWSLMRWFILPREISVARPRLTARSQEMWVGAAAVLVRRDEFLGLGGFDEEFFLYFEDFDLSRTYRERGYGVGTTDAIVVRHEGQRSSPRQEERMIAFALLGLVQYVAKWEGEAAALMAATQILALLGRIDRLGGLLRGLPVAGPRALRKRESAMTVKQFLRFDSEQLGEAQKNTAARAAFAGAYARVPERDR